MAGSVSAASGAGRRGRAATLNLVVFAPTRPGIHIVFLSIVARTAAGSAYGLALGANWHNGAVHTEAGGFGRTTPSLQLVSFLATV